MDTEMGGATNSLNVPNALLQITGPSAWCALGKDGQRLGLVPRWGVDHPRDWRMLRQRLMNLGFEKAIAPTPAALAKWLDDAGYILQDGHCNRHFTSDDFRVAGTGLNPIVSWLFEWAVVVTWGMGPAFGPQAAKRQVKRFRQYQRRTALYAPMEQPHTQRPDALAMLYEDLGGAPEYLDIRTWDEFFSVGAIEHSRAKFRLNSSMRPIVEMEALSPMHAIVLTVYIDRLFTKREMGTCKLCKQKFERRFRNQLFCSAPPQGISHQTLWKTRLRRAKVRLIRAARERAPRANDWVWIAKAAQRDLKK